MPEVAIGVVPLGKTGQRAARGAEELDVHPAVVTVAQGDRKIVNQRDVPGIHSVAQTAQTLLSVLPRKQHRQKRLCYS